MKVPVRSISCLTALLVSLASVNGAPVKVEKKDKQLKISNASVEFTYDFQRDSFEVADLTAGWRPFKGAAFTVDEVGWKQVDGTKYEWVEEAVEDEFGAGRKLTIITTPLGGYRLTKKLHVTLYEEQSFMVLGFSVTNGSKIPARVCRIGMIDEATMFPGADIEELKVLEGGAGAHPNRIQTEIPVGVHNSLMLTGKVDGQRRTMVVGGLHYRDFMRTMGAHHRRKDKFIATIEDPIGKLIAPGETFDAVDTLYLDASTTDPFVSLEQYGMAMRKANKANPKPYDFPTLCGWLVSQGSYGEGIKINHSKGLVEQMELAKESGILNYTPVGIRLEPDYYCNHNYGDTQQGWWNDAYWAKYGSLTEPYDTFAKFCGKIQELGGVPFTYIQSNMPSNDFALKHPEWMLNNDISRLHAEHRHHQPFVRYDFTEPGFQEHTLKMWQRMRDGGLKGIKFDYPETAWIANGGFEDKSYSTTNAYRKVFELCREGLGPEAFIHERNLGESGAPCLDVTAGIVDLQRVWADSSHFEPEMASRIGLRWYKNRSVFGYYPDGKSFKKMDVDQRRTMLTQVGLISGRLELGTSFGRMTDEEQRDLTRLYPVLGGTQSFRPVDMLSSAPKDPSVYVYKVDDHWSQVILCNNEDADHTLKVPLSGNQADTGSLGVDPQGSYYLYDFWNDKLVGEFKGDGVIEVTLKPYQALSYSLHRKADHPQFLSTNRHITQGLMDLSEVKWDAKALSYSGTAHCVKGEPFVVTIARNGLELDFATAETEAHIQSHGEQLIQLRLSSHAGGKVKWEIKWKKP